MGEIADDIIDRWCFFDDPFMDDWTDTTATIHKYTSIIRESDKAYRVLFANGRKLWIAKSAIMNMEDSEMLISDTSYENALIFEKSISDFSNDFDEIN